VTAKYRYPRPPILRKVPLDRHAVIEASAGTGKTYTLAHLVAELVLRGGLNLEQILIVTYTQKAAGELRARIRALLQKLLDLRVDDDTLDPEDTWSIGEAERGLLARALSAFDAASISTIHGFCQRILTEHAFEQGRLFAQSPVVAADAFKSAFLDALRQEFTVEPALRPWLVTWLAQGRDHEALAKLLFDCHSQRARLLPEVDDAALDRALAAVSAAADPEPIRAELAARKTHASTVKSCVEKVGRVQVALRAGEVPDVLAALEALDGDHIYLRAKLPSDAPRCAEFLAALAGVPPFRAAIVSKFLEKVRARLARTKAEAGLFDFDDMLGLVHGALHGPGGEHIATLLRERFHVALIDEFQDTDELQWGIFRRLFFDAPDRPVIVIGDPKQAIYAFRGADVATYLEARGAITRAGGPTVPLDSNFRSTARLIRAYNAILDQQAGPPFFDGDIRYDVPVLCGDRSRRALAPDGADAVPLHLLQPYARRPGVRADVAIAPLADRIAREAARLLASDAPLRLFEEGKTRPLAARDLFVLVSDRFRGRIVAEALRKQGLSCVLRDAGLFEAPEARDLRAVLGAIDAPGDRGQLGRAFLTPFFGLTLDELAACWELPSDDPRLRLLTRWKLLADRPDLPALLRAVLDESGIVRRLLLRPDGERGLTNLQHLVELLLEHAAQRRLTLRELLRQFDAFLDGRDRPEDAEDAWQQRLESERDAVQVMTMHISKGLEAPVVFVLPRMGKREAGTLHRHHDASGARACWVGPAPADIARATEDEQSAEDARLLYVALTRAKARLYLPYFGPLSDPAQLPLLAPAGPYARVNARLARLVGEGALASEGLLTCEPVATDNPLARALSRSGPAADLAEWAPPPPLLANADADADAAHFAGLRARAAPLVVTSYSRLKAERARERGADPSVDSARAEAHAEPLPVEPTPATALPGGAAIGTFLHELIEHLDLAEVSACATVDAFLARPAVAGLSAAAAARHDVDPRHLPEACRLVHVTLTSPVVVEPGRPPAVFARAPRVVRELEFLYPFPEASHPPLHAPWPGARVELHRGYVKGFVDFVFEHDGRAWFADWKSDSLASFAPEALAAHVDAHYLLQAQLYVLALVKLLGLRTEADYEARFGGLVYVFLRGMRAEPAGSPGVHVRRPTWSEVLAWEAALARDGFAGPGGAA
jgi:exodeoxyribonuclease V beta subunit